MKPKFKLIELIFRVPTILLMFWIIFRCVIDFDNRYLSLLFVLLGAAGWESILFILHRLGLLDVTEHWKGKGKHTK